jgi:hypothetical protein
MIKKLLHKRETMTVSKKYFIAVEVRLKFSSEQVPFTVFPIILLTYLLHGVGYYLKS